MRRKDKEQRHHLGVSRRRFIGTVGAVSMAAMFPGCSKDSKNPVSSGNDTPSAPESATVAVGNVSVYDKNVLKNKMIDMLDQLGGLGDIIKSGDKVGIKINLTGGIGSANRWQRDTGAAPGDSFWTNPILTLALGELIKDAGAGELYILESIYDTDSFREPGFNQVTGMLGATFLNTNSASPSTQFLRRSTGSNPNIYSDIVQNPIFDELDCFISLPKAKQHVSAGVTHAMKNLVGTLPQPSYSQNGSGNRAAIHNHDDKFDGNKNDNLCRVILDINKASKIHLAVNDAIKTTIGGEGPWCGTMENAEFNKLVISKDVVAADTVSTNVIGFDGNAADYTETFALPGTPCMNYLAEAERQGLGVNDAGKITVIEV